MAPATMESVGQASDEKDPTIQIVLHPMGEPRPALKYRLLPPFLSRRPGNAAIHYLKVPHEQHCLFSNQEFRDEICKLIETPLEDMRKERGEREWKYSWIAKDIHRDVFEIPPSILDNLVRGANCESCDWDQPIRECGLSMLIPEAQTARMSGWILAARARMQMADGKYDEAIKTLQTGYALARHVGRAVTLVQGLVGDWIAKLMHRQVETFIQQPEAPNLHWALAALPRPFIDLRLALEAEMEMIDLNFPDLRGVDGKNLSPEGWRELWEQTVARIWRIRHFDHRDNAKTPPHKEQVRMLAAAIEVYPQAKRYLVAEGRSAAEVEAMPVHQVLLLHTLRSSEELRDDYYKWAWMPYADARKHTEEAGRQLAARCQSSFEIIPLAGTLLPAIMAARAVAARADRDIAALQTLEAIRLYGAAHDGPPPERLADITEVPIPPDPLRGEPFLYRREGDTAILESPLPDDSPQHTLRYQIRFDRQGGKP